MECQQGFVAVAQVTFLNFRGGFKYLLFSPRTLGKMIPFSRAYFSKGLVQPPTRWSLG